MNISLDLDGVICQWQHLEKVDRTLENYDRFPPIEGAREGIRELDTWKNDLHLITARHYRGAFNHVYDWLYRNGFNEANMLQVVGIPTPEKWRVMQALEIDVHVDDNIRAFTKVPVEVTPIFFIGDHNKYQLNTEVISVSILERIRIVSSWPELVAKIKEINYGR